MSNKQFYIKTFCEYTDKFIQLAEKVLPGNIDVKYAKNGIYALKKINPKLLIEHWFIYIYVPYKDKINNNDIDFLLKGDYSFLDGVKGGHKGKAVLLKIQELITNVDKTYIDTATDYTVKLSKLSLLYASN
jgi:hypothetical protein